jgi:hypothetical protein
MYLLVSTQAFGVALVLLGLCSTVILGYIACDTVETKEDTIKAYGLIVGVFIIILGAPIAAILLKPLTVAYFGWSKTLALILGYVFHATIIAVGAIIGTLRRHDVI